jgi:hypothetical protein
MEPKAESRYRSRTYWLCWGILMISSILCWGAKIDGAGWVTVTLGTLGGWQARRAWDNKLDSEGGGS